MRARARFTLVVTCLAALAAPPGPGVAQLRRLEQRCNTGASSALACAGAVEAAALLSGRVARLTAGGNPVPGTASTIGRRIGAPRVSLAGRATLGNIEVPAIATPASTETFMAASLNADVSVGLTDGFSPAATVGGVGSIDVLASAGTILLSTEHGFAEQNPFTWLAGLRVGVLRESFTAPGISVSGTYRRVGGIERGETTPAGNASYLRLSNISAVDVSAAIGKRLTLLSLAGGAGYTWHSADATIIVDGTAGPPFITSGSVDDRRVHLFGNLSWTVRIWTLTGELGWQAKAGGLDAGRTPVSGAGGGGLFGSVAARLTI